MTSSMLYGDRRLASSSRRGAMTVLGKVPKPVNLPSQRLESHGRDPNMEIVPKGTLGWGSRSSSASNAWGSPSLSPKADGGTSPSHLSGHLSSGSGTRPSTAGSEKAHEPSSNAWGPNSRPSLASATPLLDPNDSEAQLAKMRELAKQRTKQSQEEEEERTRRQMAKALAKLEELNRRTQVVEGSNEKFAKLEELNRSTPVVEGSNEKYEEEEERTRGQTAKCFHFRPTRHVVSQQSRVSTFENCCSMDHIDLAKSGCKYAGAFDDSALISVIGQKMSHHFDNLLHAVEGLSAQLSQLETRLRRLENSVDDLKDSTEINHGRNDGKLRQLENILREVEGGMHDLRDKQEISEAKLQLATLQMLKGHQQLENQGSNVQTISTQGVLSSAPQQSHQPHSTPVACLQLSSFPPNVPPTQPHQNLPQAPAAQVHTHSPQNQIPSVQQTDSNYSPPVLNPQPAPQIYYMPQVQQSQPPPTAPYQYYPPAPHLSPTSLLQRLPQLHSPLNAVDPQAQSSLVHNPGETPYMLSQRYPPSMQKPSNATGMALPTQQQYMGSFQYTHDQSTRNHCSDLSAGHMQPVQHSTFDDFYSHEGSPSHNSGSKTKHSQILPASLDCSGGSSISRLPTAQVLPYAIPMASSVDKESSSGVTGNRVPIDNVIDEVVAMGFRRDIVRATAKKMTENGQSVDINVVLDKLMNNGEGQPKSGGFGR